MIRLSYGTAVKMGLKEGKMLAEPTTAYIMLGERCVSNCLFCAQRREGRKEGYLSRVLWLSYPEEVLRNLRGFSRVCFQTLDYPEVVNDLISLLPLLPSIPVSVSIVPISNEDMKRLKEEGVEIISIALDAATKEIFDYVKGYKVGNRFTWEGHWRALKDAAKIFDSVNTHLIVGLGESDKALYNIMARLSDMGISIALFAFMPVFGGKQPLLHRYRVIQLMRYLFSRNYRNFAEFEDERVVGIIVPEEERKNIMRGIPFLTSGCPGCNRPFYNERPGGKIYNYPFLPKENVARELIKECEEYARIIWI